MITPKSKVIEAGSLCRGFAVRAPYSELPESEKQYDRIMATDTIKQLIALRYDIVKK